MFAFAAADFAMSNTLAYIHGHRVSGVYVPGHFADGTAGRRHAYVGCFRDGSTLAKLSGSNALYFALGAITTAGSGALAAASSPCRGVVAVQLATAFPMVGLAIAGVAARLFRAVPRPPPPPTPTPTQAPPPPTAGVSTLAAPPPPPAGRASEAAATPTDTAVPPDATPLGPAPG